MTQAQGQHRDLIQSIEGLPAAPGLSPLDQDLLMLKATSMATMNCLNECLHILHLQQVARQRGSLGGQCVSECGDYPSLRDADCVLTEAPSDKS